MSPIGKGDEKRRSALPVPWRQGAYKAFESSGLVFACMGPPESKPPFSEREQNFTVFPGDELAAYSNFHHCNWLQVQGN